MENQQKKTRNVCQLVADILFGRKYYANVTLTRGTSERGLSYNIFKDKDGAAAHAASLHGNRSFAFVETITFRSRKEYI